MDSGSSIVEQLGPELSALTTVIMPAAACASTAACNVSTEQPSKAGQPHELFVISGAFNGSPWPPPIGYGARNHSMHSRYLAGVPLPWSMLRQPIHFAPGAMPIWLPTPSSPIAVPIVCVPWPMSSQGTDESLPQGFPMLSWME